MARLRRPRRVQRRNVGRDLREGLASSARYYAGGDIAARCPYLAHGLVLGAWRFSGCWSLEFGASSAVEKILTFRQDAGSTFSRPRWFHGLV